MYLPLDTCHCSCCQVLSTLTELLRDNFRVAKVKQALLPGLGEALYLIASQEQVKGHVVEQWSVPAMTYTMLTRCLREGVSRTGRFYFNLLI